MADKVTDQGSLRAIVSDSDVVYYDNTKSDIVSITKDKIRIYLGDFKKYLTRGNVLGSFTTMITLIVTFITTDFNESKLSGVGLKPEHCDAVLLVLSGMAGLWFLFSVGYALWHLNQRSIDCVINRFVKNEDIKSGIIGLVNKICPKLADKKSNVHK